MVAPAAAFAITRSSTASRAPVTAPRSCASGSWSDLAGRGAPWHVLHLGKRSRSRCDELGYVYPGSAVQTSGGYSPTIATRIPGTESSRVRTANTTGYLVTEVIQIC